MSALSMESAKEFLLALGIPGVILVAALDSAGVPMAGGPDAVVMLVSWQRPWLMPLVALAAAMGSTVGCYFLYVVGRKSGGMALRGFNQEKREWVTERLKRHDWLAILVAVLGPPPFPTKVFVLAAGAIRMSWRRFVLTVFSGRLVRFLGEGYLGARFGDRAAEVVREHHLLVLVVLLVAVVMVLVIRRLKLGGQADPA